MASTIEKQTWRVDTIRRRGRISLKELSDLWEDNTNLNPDSRELTARTFHRHREEIEKLFGLSIKCDKRDDNRYYIEEEYDVEGQGVRSWLLSTIAIDNMLKESRDIRDRIQFEDIPSGQQYLSTLISCMRDSLKVKLTYHSFRKDSDETILLEPYFVKVKGQRWYVIGASDKHPADPHVYALDRVRSLEVSDRTFRYPKDFDPEDFFRDSFGVFHTGGKPMNIKIKVSPDQQKYTDTLPLHRSQEKIEQTPEYAIYSYRMCPDYDLIQEIAGKGDCYEVLEPEEFRRTIADFLERAAKQYR